MSATSKATSGIRLRAAPIMSGEELRPTMRASGYSPAQDFGRIARSAAKVCSADDLGVRDSRHEIMDRASALLFEFDILGGGPGHREGPFEGGPSSCVASPVGARMRRPCLRRVWRQPSRPANDSGPKAKLLMAILVLGLVIFLGLHSTRIVSESGRERAIARIGEGPWKGIYSARSVIGFVHRLGFARARYGAPSSGRLRPEPATLRCF